VKRHEVEVVVLKSFDYWKSILGNEIDLGDVQALTTYVWESMKEDQDLDAQIERVYVITRRSLQRLVTKGINSFHDIYGNRIVLRFEDRGEPPCVLESGTIFLSKEHFTNYEEEKKNHNKMLKGIIVGEERFVDVQSRLDEFMKPKKDTKEEKNRGKGHEKER
jgi:hypothetical protein